MKTVLALALSASALAPGSQPKTASQTRRELGQGLMTAIGAFGAQAAVASSGDSPKFSFFGFAGNGDAMSEGAMYGADQSSKVYSPSRGRAASGRRPGRPSRDAGRPRASSSRPSRAGGARR